MENFRFLKKIKEKLILNEVDLNHNEVNTLLDEQIEEDMSGVSLFRSLNELKILRKIFLKPRHRKLLPTVLLNIKRKESLEVQEKTEDNPLTEDLRIDHALEQLFTNNPKSEVEKIIDDYIIDHLPLNQSPKDEDKPPLPETSPPFKFNISEGQDQFSELSQPRDGFSEIDSPGISFKSPESSSLWSIPSKIPNNPNRGRRQKMSIFRTQKSSKRAGEPRRIIVRNNLKDERARNLKNYTEACDERKFQISHLPIKGTKKTRPGLNYE